MKLRFTIAAILAMPIVAAYAEEQQLPTIVVEGAYERPGTFSAAPDSSVLKDTANLLERVPGAAVNRNGPLTGIAAYHGMYGNRINVNIEGMDIKEVGPNSMDPPLSHIPAPLVKSLKVQQGIAPVSSGIETIGGSMKVEMRKGRFAEGDGIETSGLASMGYSSVQEGKFGVLMGAVANKNHKVYLSGIEEKGHDYKIDGDLRQKPTQYDRDSFSTGYAYQRDGHEAELNYNNIDTGHSGTPALPMDIMYVRGGLYNGKYKWDLGEGRQFRIEGFYEKMRHLMNNYTLRTPSNNVNKSNRTTVEAGGYSLIWDMPFFGGDFSAGFNADIALNNALVTTSMMGGTNIHFFNDTQRNRYSAFAEWSRDLTEALSMELGVRYTHVWSNTGNVSVSNMMMKAADRIAFNSVDHKRNFDFVDFDAIFRYAVSDQLSLDVGFARKNRAPSYQALYLWTDASSVGGLADGNTYLGNLNLKHETAYQFDMGLEWRSDKAYVSPRVYYHYIEDYIQGLKTARAVTKGANILEFSNVDAHIFGVDLEAGYSIDENWRLDGALNYARGQILSSPVAVSNKNLYRIAPLNGRTQLSYQNAGWMGSVEGVFVARQGDVAAYNDELKTAGYMLMNVRASYEPIKNLVIGTGVENILDKRYQNHLNGYQLHNRNNGRVFSPGRNVYATVSYSW